MFDILSKDGILSLLYSLPALLVGMSFHEYAHAWVAYKLGDTHQKTQGRLTLSPFAHIDPLGFIFILLFRFGWGRPVTIDDTNFKHKERDAMFVALAGPVMNLVLALFFTIICKLLIITDVYSLLMQNNIGAIVIQILYILISFNVVFAVFNLIPIPPFDGSRVVYYFLRGKARTWYYKIEKYSIWILIALMITGWYSYLIMPAYSLIASFLNYILLL